MLQSTILLVLFHLLPPLARALGFFVQLLVFFPSVRPIDKRLLFVRVLVKVLPPANTMCINIRVFFHFYYPSKMLPTVSAWLTAFLANSDVIFSKNF